MNKCMTAAAFTQKPTDFDSEAGGTCCTTLISGRTAGSTGWCSTKPA